MTTTNPIDEARARVRWYYNGVRIDGDRELVKLWYWDSSSAKEPAGTIRVSATGYRQLPSVLADAFVVENDRDSMTDYFEKDKFNVRPDHPLYAEVLAAKQALDARRAAQHAKNEARWSAARAARAQEVA